MFGDRRRYRHCASPAAVAALLALALAAADVQAADEPSVEDCVKAVQKGIKKGRIVVVPHDFQKHKDNGGYLEGGVPRADVERERPTPSTIIIDTICLLEAKTVGLSQKQRADLEAASRQQIESIIGEQLQLIAEHKGTEDELCESLLERQSRARDAFDAAAKGLGFHAFSEGDKRWTITFRTRPEGGTVLFMCRGDWDWYNDVGFKKGGPRWNPAADSERWGNLCEYYVCAKWPDGRSSDVQPVKVTGHKTVVLTPKAP